MVPLSAVKLLDVRILNYKCCGCNVMNLSWYKNGAFLCKKCFSYANKRYPNLDWPKLFFLYLDLRRYTEGRKPTIPDHYKTLGIEQSANASDIKSAYYKLSFLYHPDKNVGDEKKAAQFREITEAYEVLGNVETRKRYDRSLGIAKIAEESQNKGESTHVDIDGDYTSFYRRRSRERQEREASSAFRSVNVKKDNYDSYYKMHYGPTSTLRDGTEKYKPTYEFRGRNDPTPYFIFAFGVFWLLIAFIDSLMMQYEKTEEPNKPKN